MEAGSCELTALWRSGKDRSHRRVSTLTTCAMACTPASVLPAETSLREVRGSLVTLMRAVSKRSWMVSVAAYADKTSEPRDFPPIQDNVVCSENGA